MARIMKCRHCKADLYCRDCGERQTPDPPNRTRVSQAIDSEVVIELDRIADEEGLSRNEVINRALRKSTGVESDGGD